MELSNSNTTTNEDVLQQRHCPTETGSSPENAQLTSRQEEQDEQPPMVTDEGLLFQVFKKLTAREVALCATVCSIWRRVAHSPLLWKRYCARVHGKALSQSLALKCPSWTWEQIFLSCPRLRVDGVFVSANRYSKYGSAQTACYYRYLRVFSSSNACLYKCALSSSALTQFDTSSAALVFLSLMITARSTPFL